MTMKFHYYFPIISLFLLFTSSIVHSANSNKHQYAFTDHMISTQTTIQTAVLTPTTSFISSSPTLDINASPSYNTSYGEPAPILQTQNTWHDIIHGILFMIIGLMEVFYGYRLIRITLLVMGFLFWSSTSVVILLLIDNSGETVRSSLYYFAIWLGFGILGGLLSYWCWHLGLLLSSAYGGFAFIITLLTLVRIPIDILRYFIISFFVLLPSIVVYKFERHSINVATSIAGSYTFFYGIDEFAHQGYREMIQLTRPEGTLRFKPTTVVYIMIVFTILLAAFGIAFEHVCHEIPCYNSWCGDKLRNGKHPERENTTTHHTDEVQQTSNLFFSKKLLCIWNHVRDFGNLLLVKIKLGLSNRNNKNINQIDGNGNMQHVINIE